MIRVYSHEAAAKVKLEGGANDLIDRIAADARIPLSKDEILAELDPAKYIGRSPSQVEEFLAQVVRPVLDRYAGDELSAQLNI